MDRANSIFDQIDKDKSGGIDKDELLFHLLELGQEYETISDMFARLDTDNDGLISRQEFVDGFERYQAFCKESAKRIAQGPVIRPVRSGMWFVLDESYLAEIEKQYGLKLEERCDIHAEFASARSPTRAVLQQRIYKNETLYTYYPPFERAARALRVGKKRQANSVRV